MDYNKVINQVIYFRVNIYIIGEKIKQITKKLNVNLVDYLSLSGLQIAFKNNKMDKINLLLDKDIDHIIKDYLGKMELIKLEKENQKKLSINISKKQYFLLLLYHYINQIYYE